MKEAVSMPRNRWLLTTLENVRIKILVIAGRLIDVAIIHGDDPLLRNISTWLRQVEEDLDPSKDIQELRLLSSLRKRADRLTTVKVGTMTQEQAVLLFVVKAFMFTFV